MSNAVINEYKQLKAETSELLGSIGESLIDLCQGPPSEEHAEAYVAIDEQIQKFFTAYYDLKKRHELSKLSVAVLALTKSGKSTLINAFLGNELLPVNNVPETARICRITHSTTAECPEPILEFKPLAKRTSSNASSFPGDVLEPASSLASGCSIASSPSQQGAVVVVRGSEQIREHLQQLNRDVRSREYTNSDEQLLEITAPLVVLNSSSSGTAGSSSSTDSGSSSEGEYSGIKLCLLDTPGPNEAGEEGLKYQVERLLDRVDAAIYLLDYTKLKTAEEAAVLERLKSINPSLVARLCSRLFFAVNKMDQAGESCGLDEDETREYVAEMVTRQLNCPDFKLHPDQVLLLSARNALLSRLVLQSRADPDNLKRFSRIAFGAYNNKSSSSSRSTEVMRAAAGDMLEGSGVPELEQAVLGFLFEAAAGVKLVAVLDDMGRLLTEVSNVAASCRGALAASASCLAASTQALQSELDITLNQFDCGMDGTQDLQVEVVDELRAHLGNLRSRLFQFICSSLDAEALYSAAAANAAAAAAAEAEQLGGTSSSRHGRHYRHHRCCRHSRRHRHYTAPGSSSSSNNTASEVEEGCDCEQGSAAPGSSPRGWRKLRERFVRLFGSLAGAGCESRDELSSALMDLSEDLMGQVQSEVSEMWSVMESAANARAGRLVDSLNAAIQGLGARLEGVVEEGLQIRLEPVTLRMAAPDACQFHADLTDLIEKGIGAEQARHVRSCERTEMVWEARRGVCRLTPYYVQVPRRRRIVETYTSTSYVLKPDAVAEHFMGVVDAAITATERQLAAYVKEYVRRQVQTARDKVKEYGDRYLDSMGAALDAASRGADARAAALAQVDGYCNTLSQLRSQLAGVQARAELLVPHNSGTGVGVFEQLEYMIDEDEEQQQHEQEEAAADNDEGKTVEDAAAAAAAESSPDRGVEAAVLGELSAAPALAAAAAVSGMIRAASTGSGSSSSCPDLLTAEEVNEAVLAEASAAAAATAAAAAGTLLMSSLPQHQHQQQASALDGLVAVKVFNSSSRRSMVSESDKDDEGMPELLPDHILESAATGQAAQAAASSSRGFNTAAIADVDSDGSDELPSLLAAPPGDVDGVTPNVGWIDDYNNTIADQPALNTLNTLVLEPAAAAAALIAAAAVPAHVQVIDLSLDTDSEDSDDMPRLISDTDETILRAVPEPAAAEAMQLLITDIDDNEEEIPGLIDDAEQYSLSGTHLCVDEPEPAAVVEQEISNEELPQLLDSPPETTDGVTPTLELPDGTDSTYPAAAAAAAHGTAAAANEAAEVVTLTLDDIFGGVPVAPMAEAAVSGGSSILDFLVDIDAIAGAHLAADVLPVTAAVAPVAPEIVLPAVTGSTSAAAPAEQQSVSSDAATAVKAADPVAAAVDSPTLSTGSVAETAVSDSFSVMTAGSNGTGFSGMTAGTGFTLGSINTQGSGYSRTQEHLANSVLTGTAAAADNRAAAAGSGSVPDAGTSSMYSPAGFSYHSAMGMGSSVHSVAASNAPEQQHDQQSNEPLDASLYASIVAHSADDTPTAAAGSSGTPSSAGYDFQRDFAAALSAAGLDGVGGQGPSESGSDDWCMVEGQDAEQQQQ